MGTFLDNVAALVIFVPTMMGVVNALHIDNVYFGVFTIIALAVGQFTPPVGLNLFIAANIANVSFESVVKEVLPYIGTYVLLLIVFIFVPDLLTIFAQRKFFHLGSVIKVCVLDLLTLPIFKYITARLSFEVLHK